MKIHLIENPPKIGKQKDTARSKNSQKLKNCWGKNRNKKRFKKCKHVQ